jgi:PAS domain S-box-containing protein
LIDAKPPRSDAELRRSEERFRLAAQCMSDLIYDWHVETGVVEWYGDIDAALGHAPGGFPRTLAGWESALHPDDRAAVMQELHASVAEARTFVVEYRIVDRSGTARYWQDRGMCIPDATGRIVRLVGACRDVTDRRRAERALAESEARFRELFHGNPHAIVVYDAATLRIVAVNNAAVALYGWSRNEFVQLTTRHIRIEDPSDAGAAGALAPRIRRHRTKHGGVVEVEVAHSLLYEGGRALQVAVVTDVTSRRRAERALAESESQFRAVFENALDPMVIIWANGATSRSTLRPSRSSA